MRIVRHPLVDQDLAALVDHIVEVTGGDFDAAGRRLDEVDALITDISTNPGPASDWRLPSTDGWSAMADEVTVLPSFSAQISPRTASSSHLLPSVGRTG